MATLYLVSFGTTTIQKMRRIALDQTLLANLGLQEGDSVRIELDVRKSTILIRKADAASSVKRIVRKRSARA